MGGSGLRTSAVGLRPWRVRWLDVVSKWASSRVSSNIRKQVAVRQPYLVIKVFLFNFEPFVLFISFYLIFLLNLWIHL